MPLSDPKFRHMSLGQLRRLAQAGDPEAIRACQEYQAEWESRASDLNEIARLPERLAVATRRSSVSDAAQRLGEKLNREKREAVEREQALIQQVTALRESAEAANARAAAAEKETADAVRRSERWQRWSLAVAVLSLIVAIAVALLSLG
jgi:hypothetical protein